MGWKILLKYMQQEDQKIEKVLFTGLDNAGKTSIISVLKREFAQIESLTPTLGSQKRIFYFLGRAIAEFDLGGQEKYRISYLKRPNDYFANTTMTIYVIDIQEKKRFNESIDYLEKVVQTFDKLEIVPFIHVFFHKADPKLSKDQDNEFASQIKDLKENIEKNLDYKKIDFHTTSIYNISSILHAMSEIFLSLVPKTTLLDKILEKFAKKTNSEGVLLVDNNSLFVGSYFANTNTKDFIMDSIPNFLSLSDSFEKTDQTSFDNSNILVKPIVIKKYQKNFILAKILVKENEPPYYLLMVKKNSKYNSRSIQSLSILLGDLLY